ncbi:Fic family protein [uncultured Treponema sp.]|uniref:Fic family protein n=1 Tax=uncultured Treponema sp. TaxID=162155 RepID=UPI001B714755|nr:Fic family protein [uncultured Treponema sp.]MBP3742717.1 Fic family protein [Treponema sp.]
MPKQNLVETLNEYLSLGINQQLDYDKFYLYSIITHSTAIEGSTVTEIENQLLFDEGISANKPMAEQLMNLDLKAAYEQSFVYAKTHTDFSIELLCKLASLVMKNTGSTYKNIAGEFSSAKGDLRLLNVSAGRGGKSYLAWQKVPDSLQAFCDWLNKERKSINKKDIQKIYELSFEAHYRIVSIHPWADGNGRMSRLIMNMIQYEAGVIPSIVKKENRAEYIQSLALSQENDDSSTFVEFMLNHHIENLQKQIAEYKASMKTDDVKGGQKIVAGGQKKWSENALRILALLKQNPKISRKELCEELKINPSAVQKHIEKLKEANKIERIGGAKGGEWRVNE